jgi:hypothetical protein
MSVVTLPVETNPLTTPHTGSRSMSLAQVHDLGGKITRIRILTERNRGETYADISYVQATLPDGEVVQLRVLTGNYFPLRQINAALLDWARFEQVYGKAMDLFNPAVRSILY